jgi:hypothetical protein
MVEAAVGMANAVLPFKRPEGNDPREQNHDHDHSNGRMPNYNQ